jgi:carotenoid cleavage dioxygenase-like enzyme
MWLSNASAAPGVVHNYTADLKRGTLVRTKADFCSCEFPSVRVQPLRSLNSSSRPLSRIADGPSITCVQLQVHPQIAGKRWRYAYLMASDSPQKPIPFQEIVKFDREGILSMHLVHRTHARTELFAIR